MTGIRWDYEGEVYVARVGPEVVGRVERWDAHRWEASCVFGGTALGFRRLRDAQRWVEKRAEA
jgi:hypothetical protein